MQLYIPDKDAKKEPKAAVELRQDGNNVNLFIADVLVIRILPSGKVVRAALHSCDTGRHTLERLGFTFNSLNEIETY